MRHFFPQTNQETAALRCISFKNIAIDTVQDLWKLASTMTGLDETTESSPMRGAAKRWTLNLLEKGGGFTPVANHFIYKYASLDPPLSPTDAMIIIHMMSRKWDLRPVAVSSELLALELGISSGQVRQRLRDLETKKHVLKSMTGPSKVKLYDFTPLLVKLEALLRTDNQTTPEETQYYREIEESAKKLAESKEDILF
ncbi:MAG: hypothetical protein U0930_20145 [Pirellulales bacterium]